MALLPYTSGTTGLPKGCVHNHSSLMHNAVAGAQWGLANAEMVTLAVVPMFHITGTVSMMHTAILAGATLVIMPRWGPRTGRPPDLALEGHQLDQHPDDGDRPVGQPEFRQLRPEQPGPHRRWRRGHAAGGGAAPVRAVRPEVPRRLRPDRNRGALATNPFENPKQQCLGIPFASTDSRVVDPDTLQEMPIGESGEIVTHGPEVFVGYWKRPDATAAAFVEIEGKRFFRTGDMGRMDEDGYFFMTDRLKRMINASGFKAGPGRSRTAVCSSTRPSRKPA